MKFGILCILWMDKAMHFKFCSKIDCFQLLVTDQKFTLKGDHMIPFKIFYLSSISCKAPVRSSLPINQHPVFLQAGCPSCCQTNNVKSAEGKISHSMDLLTPGEGLPTLCLTTNSFWLHWGRVAMPFISPLMPVPKWLGIW